MEALLAKETPGKVLGLLGAALGSMMLLLLVSGTNASFESRISQTGVPSWSVFTAMENSADAFIAAAVSTEENVGGSSLSQALDSYGLKLAEGYDSLRVTLGGAQTRGQVAGAYIEAGGETGLQQETGSKQLYTWLVR